MRVVVVGVKREAARCRRWLRMVDDDDDGDDGDADDDRDDDDDDSF
jgi:hypothetical protein